MQTERQPQTSRAQISDGEPHSRQRGVNERESCHYIRIFQMRRREWNRGKHHAKPGNICARQCLQHVAAEKHFFSRRREQKHQNGNEQSFADQPEARRIETETSAPRYRREQSREKKRCNTKRGADQQIAEPALMGRATQGSERQIFQQRAAGPSDKQRRNQNRAMPRGDAP